MHVIILGGNFGSYTFVMQITSAPFILYYGGNFDSYTFIMEITLAPFTLYYRGKFGFLISLYITMLMLHAFIHLCTFNNIYFSYSFQTYHEILTSRKAHKNNITQSTTL